MKSKIGELQVFMVGEVRGSTHSIGVEGHDIDRLSTGVVFQTADASSQWELAVIPHVCGPDDPRLFKDRLYVGVTPISGSGQLQEGMRLEILREGGMPPALVLGMCVFTAGKETYSVSMTREECDRLKGTWTAGGTR